MNSLVSVIMPYYDKKDYFFDSINSVLNQTYKNQIQRIFRGLYRGIFERQVHF